jgi:hypothetical protein
MMIEASFNHAVGDWSAPLPHHRMRVYRNNVKAALVNALQVRFPVSHQLVGGQFFAAMAEVFATDNRPASPVLIDYGEAFPDFIRTFPPAGSVPYLGDVADLENLWWAAYHAADVATLGPRDFELVPDSAWGDVRFAFHCSLGLGRSSYAAASIWAAHHGGPRLAEVQIDAPEGVLVCRAMADVTVRVIDPVSHDFLATLRGGMILAETVELMTTRHGDFDLNSQLQGLLGLNIITGLKK